MVVGGWWWCLVDVVLSMMFVLTGGVSFSDAYHAWMETDDGGVVSAAKDHDVANVLWCCGAMQLVNINSRFATPAHYAFSRLKHPLTMLTRACMCALLRFQDMDNVSDDKIIHMIELLQSVAGKVSWGWSQCCGQRE